MFYVWFSRQSPWLLQRGRCCHRLDRLASRLWLHQHHACGSGGLNNQRGCSAFSLYLHLSFKALCPTPHSSSQPFSQIPPLNNLSFRQWCKKFKKIEYSLLYNSTLCLHSFHIDSLNQISLQGLRIIDPNQKLLYLFTQTLVLLKVNQSKSECILVCVHVHTGSCLGGVGGGADWS